LASLDRVAEIDSAVSAKRRMYSSGEQLKRHPAALGDDETGVNASATL
jgi:hypothetical protein